MDMLACEHCGEPLAEGEMYCCKCGTKMGSKTPPAQPPRPKSAMGFLILAAILVLLAAGSVVATIMLTGQSPRPINIDPEASKIATTPSDYAAYSLFMMQEAIPLVDRMEMALYEFPNRAVIESQVSQVNALLADFLQYRSPEGCEELAAYLEKFGNDLYIFNFLVETAFAPPISSSASAEPETDTSGMDITDATGTDAVEATSSEGIAPEIPGGEGSTEPESVTDNPEEEPTGESVEETTAPVFLTTRISELAESLREQYTEAEYGWESMFPDVPYPSDVKWPQESVQLREGYTKDLNDFVSHIADVVSQIERARREVRPESFIMSRNLLLDEIAVMQARTDNLNQRMQDNFDEHADVFVELIEILDSLYEVSATYVTDADDYMKYGMEVYNDLVEKDLTEIDEVLALLSTYDENIQS